MASVYRPGAHGAVGTALAAPTFAPQMGVSNYVGVSDIGVSNYMYSKAERACSYT